MNPETERDVWRRVNSPGQLTAPEALLPEQLEHLIRQTRLDAAQLRRLAGQLGGQDRAIFSRLASENADRAMALTTLHYLLTGRRLKLRLPPLPPPLPPEEAMREAYHRQKQAARALGELGSAFELYARQFAEHQAEAERQARLISQRLQKRMS